MRAGLALKPTTTDIWLDELLNTPVRKVPSPNCNARPDPGDISLLVIHNISLPAGSFGGDCVEKLFTNCLDCGEHPDFEDLRGLEVSAHLFIDRAGDIIQFVPFNLRAWHAGVSAFDGCSHCNDYSIGIELEGTDSCPYTDDQYRSLASVSAAIMARYPQIGAHRIVGHSDIAPDRKTDPGEAFDWAYYRRLLR